MNQRQLKHIPLLVAAILVAKAGVYFVLGIFDVADPVYSNLVFNILFLFTSLGCMRLLRLSARDVGLKIISGRFTLHAGLTLAIFTVMSMYYLFGVRISGFRPFTSSTVWGLLNYLVVAIAEEVYFRGLWYHVIEKRFSGRAAVLVSGLLFGLVHYREGFGMLPKFFTGWLWGSVRYATGTIILLIPLHFTYNSVWLLFEGNWDNTPSAYLFPFAELLGAILIVAWVKSNRHPGMMISEILK